MDIYLRESRVRFALEAQWLAWEGRPAKSRGYFSLRRFSVGSGGFHGDMTVGYGCFDDIPKEEKAQYLEIKQGTQDGKIDEFWEDKQKKNRGEQGKTLRKLILKMKEDGSSVTEIAEFTGLSEQTVMNYCTKARKERGDNDRFR
jgi:DNA-binding CsgD family transcriptional regulator